MSSDKWYTHKHNKKRNFVNFGRQKDQKIQSILSPYQHTNTGHGGGSSSRGKKKKTTRFSKHISEEWLVLSIGVPIPQHEE